MIFGYENGLTILLAVVGLVITLVAQLTVSGSYHKYKKVKNKKGITGSEAAREILDNNGLEEIYVVLTKGELSDHYDPRRKVIRLSKDVYHGDSIAAIAIAAHEVGHAIQDKDGYLFMKIRSFLCPIVNVVTYLGYFAMIFSIFIGAMGYFTVGAIVLLAALLFQLVTLPVEFNASTRGKQELSKLKMASSEESEAVASVLRSAAFTYVASFVSTILSLLRIIIMAQDRE